MVQVAVVGTRSVLQGIGVVEGRNRDGVIYE